MIALLAPLLEEWRERARTLRTSSGETTNDPALIPREVAASCRGARSSVPLRKGALTFGDTSNAQQGSAQGTFTAHLNIVSKGGGVVDTVRQTGHFGANGEFEFDHGSCLLPE